MSQLKCCCGEEPALRMDVRRGGGCRRGEREQSRRSREESNPALVFYICQLKVRRRRRRSASLLG
jgi:hypothetical protein